MRGQKISKKIWLFMHPRNFGQKSPVRTQRPHPHSEHPTYGQMTEVIKKGYPLISVT